MPKICDHTSVGVIVKNIDDKFALLKRARGAVGMAPPAGHVDSHGSAAQAALDEVEEEIGLIIDPSDLRPTKIKGRKMANPCRREGGDYHVWTVYEAQQFLGDITPDPEETLGANWYSAKDLQAMAKRTKAYQKGRIPEEEWRDNPGLEEIWLDFLSELGYVT